jgi:hypothetical protein
MLGSTLVATLPKPLLKVASSKFEEIYENEVVELPNGTDIDGVVHLIDYLEVVMNTLHKPSRMRNNLTTFESLSACTAAHVLGMDKYVTHVFKSATATSIMSYCRHTMTSAPSSLS